MGPFDNYIHIEKMERIRSSTLMNSSKTANVLSTSDLSPQVSPKKGFHNLDTQHSKIEADILSKKISNNKKDYFVFSMGDSSNQNKSENVNIIKFNQYKDFLWKINYSNGLYVKSVDDI
jgi:hypothetical protein